MFVNLVFIFCGFGIIGYISSILYSPCKGSCQYNSIDFFYFLDYLIYMPSNKPKVLLILDEDLLERIDDFRYENRIPARNEAIRRLITEALKKYEKKAKK